MRTADEPLQVIFKASLVPGQHQWLEKHSPRIQSITFHPEDSAASDVVASDTQLGRCCQTLRAAHNVQIRPRFKEGIALFTGLQSLSVCHTEYWTCPIALRDQLTLLPVSLRELAITRGASCILGKHASLPGQWLPVQHLTNLSSLTLCNTGCADSNSSLIRVSGH